MQYKVGMFGGSFDPLHTGHVRSIIRAASMCEELHLILSYSLARDRINYKQRHQWLRAVTCGVVDNVTIHCVEDKELTKDDYDWEAGAKDIKNAIGKPIDVVFCGTDYMGKDIFEKLYPESKVVYLDRLVYGKNISSTEIKSNPLKYWDYIPNVVRPYYTKKVLIVGSESTGKSTLTKKLAAMFNTEYLHEVGRDICERSGSEDLMLEHDFYEIMIRHKSLEFDKLSKANKVLFIDTDVVTTLFYSKLLCKDEELLSNLDKIATGMAKLNHYDLVLFLEPDVAFIQDGTRNDDIADNRRMYSDILYDELVSHGLHPYKISGDYDERFNHAVNLVNSLFTA